MSRNGKPAELAKASGSRAEVNEALARTGFCQLNDPDLVHQLAFMVEDHDHFGRVLRKIEPSRRNTAYEAMRPYLRFEAKPLYIYLLV